MPLFTTVDPATIATALGQATPTGPTAGQWQMWIDDALMLIQARVDSITPTPTVDQARLDYVIREAVVAQVRRPDDSTQVTVSVDDGSVSKTYRSGAGRVSILDDWWNLLGLGGATSAGKAFEVDTLPTGAGSGRYGIGYWWSSPSTAEPIP